MQSCKLAGVKEKKNKKNFLLFLFSQINCIFAKHKYQNTDVNTIYANNNKKD